MGVPPSESAIQISQIMKNQRWNTQRRALLKQAVPRNDSHDAAFQYTLPLAELQGTLGFFNKLEV